MWEWQGVATVASDNGKVSVAIFCTSWAFLAGGYSSPWLLEGTNHLGASSSNLVGILFPLCHAHFLCSLQQNESWQMWLLMPDLWPFLLRLLPHWGFFLVELGRAPPWPSLIFYMHSTLTIMLRWCHVLCGLQGSLKIAFTPTHLVSILESPFEAQPYNILLSAHLLHLDVTWALHSHSLPNQFHYLPLRMAVLKTKFLLHSLPQLFHMNKSNSRVKDLSK